MPSLLSRILLPLAVLAAYLAPAHSQTPPPGYLSINLGTALPTSYGAAVEWRSPAWYAVQAEWFRRNEFEGIFPTSGSRPTEDYQASTVSLGALTPQAPFEAGVFLGAGYAEGLMRGELRGTDDGCSLMGCSGTTNYHDTLTLAGPVFQLSFFAGIGGKNHAVRLAPHIYFARGRSSFVLPLVFQTRFR